MHPFNLVIDLKSQVNVIDHTLGLSDLLIDPKGQRVLIDRFDTGTSKVSSTYSPDQSKVKRRAGKFLKSKCEISFSIRYLIFESYWAGEILKASKVAFKN